MSQKKNYYLKAYLETQIVVSYVVLEQIINYETTEKEKELLKRKALIEKFTFQQLKLKYLEDLKKAIENSEEILPTIPENLTEENLIINPDEILISQEEVDALGTETEIISKYDLKLKSVKKKSFIEIYNIYRQFLSNSIINSIANKLFIQKNQKFNYSKLFNIILQKVTKSSWNWDYKIFNIKVVLFTDTFLILDKLNTNFLKLSLNHKKLKFKKWKLKKKRFRKLYILRKLRKTLIFKRFKLKNYKSLFKTTKFMLIFNKFFQNILVQRIPISERVASQQNVEFFYKLEKNSIENINFFYKNGGIFMDDINQKVTIFARNYHQKPYWKLRKSRLAHWKLFFKKTIRQQRYKAFIGKFIKNYWKLSYSYSFLINFFTKFRVSWTRSNKFESFFKTFLTQKNSKVVKLPLFFAYYFNWKFLKKKNYYLKKKVGRWSFLNFKRATRPWLQRKKNAPKQVKHIQPNCFFLKKYSQWDVMTGYLYLKYENLSFMFPITDNFKVNFLIKLHMYRYKSNKKCI